jgi:uncharacterized integral membrane protein (TIGR00697 family)
MPRKEKLYFILGTLFVVIVILSNITGGKLVESPFGGIVPSSLFLYPLTFFIGDLLAEIYGGARARYVIYLGFAMALLMHFLALFLLALPLHPKGETTYQTSLETLFNFNGFSLASSLFAYIVSQLIDLRTYLWFKNKTHNRLIWLRTNVSTILSQTIDSFLINVILFYGFLGWSFGDAMKIFSSAIILKAAFSILLTPFFYFALNLSRRYVLAN